LEIFGFIDFDKDQILPISQMRLVVLVTGAGQLVKPTS
jgi:hypothetical protein